MVFFDVPRESLMKSERRHFVYFVYIIKGVPFGVKTYNASSQPFLCEICDLKYQVIMKSKFVYTFWYIYSIVFEDVC